MKIGRTSAREIFFYCQLVLLIIGPSISICIGGND